MQLLYIYIYLSMVGFIKVELDQIMGALDHLSDLCSMTETKEALKLRKKRPLQVRFVEFRDMCFCIFSSAYFLESVSAGVLSCEEIYRFSAVLLSCYVRDL